METALDLKKRLSRDEIQALIHSRNIRTDDITIPPGNLSEVLTALNIKSLLDEHPEGKEPSSDLFYNGDFGSLIEQPSTSASTLFCVRISGLFNGPELIEHLNQSHLTPANSIETVCWGKKRWQDLDPQSAPKEWVIGLGAMEYDTRFSYRKFVCWGAAFHQWNTYKTLTKQADVSAGPCHGKMGADVLLVKFSR